MNQGINEDDPIDSSVDPTEPDESEPSGSATPSPTAPTPMEAEIKQNRDLHKQTNPGLKQKMWLNWDQQQALELINAPLQNRRPMRFVTREKFQQMSDRYRSPARKRYRRLNFDDPPAHLVPRMDVFAEFQNDDVVMDEFLEIRKPKKFRP